MEDTARQHWLPCCASLLLLATAGCGSLENVMIRPKPNAPVVAQASAGNSIATGSNQIRSASARLAASDDRATVAATNASPRAAAKPAPAPPEQSSVPNGYEANPTFIAGLEQARQVNSLLNPTPTAPLVNLGLGLLSAVATGLAAYKSRREQRTRAQLEPKAGALASVVKAVELFPGGEISDLKEHIATHAQLDGTADDLHAVVQSITAAAR